jgi:excisionase family DNA binding protein
LFAAPILADIQANLAKLLAIADRPKQRFFSIDHAAGYAGLSTKTIRRLLSSGKLRALRPVKGRILIDRDELDALVLSSDQRPRRGRGIRPHSGESEPDRRRAGAGAGRSGRVSPGGHR